MSSRAALPLLLLLLVITFVASLALGEIRLSPAQVLEALRAELGDATFRAGLRRFYKDWRFRKAGTADFEQAFEAESGRPLGPFFETWFLGGGSR